MANPLISICIPAFKRTDFLIRLLDSIADQSFRDFEVVVTDDSPDNSVQLICDNYREKFELQYYKNEKALGTPANWNSAISKAKGEWIKLMHDDDWFENSISLQLFAKAIVDAPNCNFIFSGFFEVDQKSKLQKKYILSFFEEQLLKNSPYNLFKKNFIGHPSTTLIFNDRKMNYDEKLSWVVDFEYYIRIIKSGKPFFAIKQPLIKIGISDSQVTKQVFRKREVEIPENIYLLNKVGTSVMQNIFVYDYYWRFLRNLSIRNCKEISEYVKNDLIPLSLIRMLNFQKKFPERTLNFGLVSKTLMFVCYLFNLFAGK